jgi:hypothetical protein
MEHCEAERRTRATQRNVAANSGTGTVCGWFRFVADDMNVLHIGMRVRGGCVSTRLF